MLNFQIEAANSRYIMLSQGRGVVSVPFYSIVRTSDGAVVHQGKRKHVVEMWNTRYNLARPRAFSA
jgi:hypothetical protein